MINLDTLVNMLEKWPLWKTISGLPDRVTALENKIAKLEALKLEKLQCSECMEGPVQISVEREAADDGLDQERTIRTCPCCKARVPGAWRTITDGSGAPVLRSDLPL